MLPHHTKITKYAFILFVILVLAYAYFEARNMLYGPVVTVNAPENAISVTDELIEISGNTKNVVEITLGGRPIFIDDQGVFTERLLLTPGVNRFVFEARDRFGRNKRELLEVVYTPQEPTTRQNNRNTDTIEESLEN